MSWTPASRRRASPSCRASRAFSGTSCSARFWVQLHARTRFSTAFRLPNQFRAIFGEGAFNAAYVPSYSRVLTRRGRHEAGRFASQIFTTPRVSDAGAGLAEMFTPGLVGLLAPGFDADPAKFAHAVLMTRITFVPVLHGAGDASVRHPQRPSQVRRRRFRARAAERRHDAVPGRRLAVSPMPASPPASASRSRAWHNWP